MSKPLSNHLTDWFCGSPPNPDCTCRRCQAIRATLAELASAKSENEIYFAERQAIRGLIPESGGDFAPELLECVRKHIDRLPWRTRRGRESWLCRRKIGRLLGPMPWGYAMLAASGSGRNLGSRRPRKKKCCFRA